MIPGKKEFLGSPTTPLWDSHMIPTVKKSFYTYFIQGDTMLNKIKKFVKDIQPTTWILIAVGVLAAVILVSVTECSRAAVPVPTETVK